LILPILTLLFRIKYKPSADDLYFIRQNYAKLSKINNKNCNILSQISNFAGMVWILTENKLNVMEDDTRTGGQYFAVGTQHHKAPQSSAKVGSFLQGTLGGHSRRKKTPA